MMMVNFRGTIGIARQRDGTMILLHGFIKKTQKTPQTDIDLALANGR